MGRIVEQHSAGAFRQFASHCSLDNQPICSYNLNVIMIPSQTYKDLFRRATISDLLLLLRSMLDSRDLRPQDALALAGAAHAGLRKHGERNGSAYAQYARTMALLRHEMPEVHEHVAANWRPPETRSSPPKRTYTDSLFDDTALVPVPGSKNINESDSEPQTEDDK